MILSVHQPNYIPWLGFFHKMSKSDIFVILDDVQYVRRSYINRSRIKTHQGQQWLTIPVCSGNNNKCRINNVMIDKKQDWKQNHLKNIENNYKKAEFFESFYPVFREFMMYDCSGLSGFNMNFIKKICDILDIGTKMLLSSELGIEESSTKRIVDICKAVGATAYLSGRGGAKYQDEQMFYDNHIELRYSNFVQKSYKQLWGEFTGGLSVVDYIFNCGYDIKEFFGDMAWTG